jgi:plastocyanin
VAAGLCAALLGCNPVTGTGSGTPPDPQRFLHTDPGAKSLVLTLIAGYPATDYQFNFDGYADGQMTVTVPVGWRATVQCENRGTVPHSCSITRGDAPTPAQPGWTTPDPTRGLQPHTSASFQFQPERPGRYRITCLVPGHEASGMWDNLVVSASGQPSIVGFRSA